MQENSIGKFCFYDLLQFTINIGKLVKLVNTIGNCDC